MLVGQKQAIQSICERLTLRLFDMLTKDRAKKPNLHCLYNQSNADEIKKYLICFSDLVNHTVSGPLYVWKFLLKLNENESGVSNYFISLFMRDEENEYLKLLNNLFEHGIKPIELIVVLFKFRISEHSVVSQLCAKLVFDAILKQSIDPLALSATLSKAQYKILQSDLEQYILRIVNPTQRRFALENATNPNHMLGRIFFSNIYVPTPFKLFAFVERALRPDFDVSKLKHELVKMRDQPQDSVITTRSELKVEKKNEVESKVQVNIARRLFETMRLQNLSGNTFWHRFKVNDEQWQIDSLDLLNVFYSAGVITAKEMFDVLKMPPTFGFTVYNNSDRGDAFRVYLNLLINLVEGGITPLEVFDCVTIEMDLMTQFNLREKTIGALILTADNAGLVRNYIDFLFALIKKGLPKEKVYTHLASCNTNVLISGHIYYIDPLAASAIQALKESSRSAASLSLTAEDDILAAEDETFVSLQPRIGLRRRAVSAYLD